MSAIPNLSNISNISRLGSKTGLVPRGPYILQISSMGNVSPADGVTYYIGNVVHGSTITATSARTYIPQKGVLKKCYIFVRASTPGSNEQVTISILVNGVTEYIVSNSVSINTTNNVIINTSLSIPLNEGDYICFKLICPTWVTNPTFQFISRLGVEPSPFVPQNTKYISQRQATGLSPAASTTYAIGGDALFTTNIPTARIYIPYSGIITAAFLNVRISTNSSNEPFTFSIRKNDATDYDITTTATCDATNRDFNNVTMSVPVTAGDYITLKQVCPAWVTPPTGVTTRVTLVIDI